jgi:hypothetical protein
MTSSRNHKKVIAAKRAMPRRLALCGYGVSLFDNHAKKPTQIYEIRIGLLCLNLVVNACTASQLRKLISWTFYRN